MVKRPRYTGYAPARKARIPVRERTREELLEDITPYTPFRTGGELIEERTPLQEYAREERERKQAEWRGQKWRPLQTYEERILQKYHRGEKLTPQEAVAIGLRGRFRRLPRAIKRRKGEKGIQDKIRTVAGLADEMSELTRANELARAVESVVIPYARIAREGDDLCRRKAPPGCAEWKATKERFHRAIWSSFGKCYCVAGVRIPVGRAPEHLGGISDEEWQRLWKERMEERERQKVLSRERRSKEAIAKEVARMSPSEYYELVRRRT